MIKKMIAGALVIILTVCACFYVALHSKPATKEELNQFEQRVNQRIEILERNQDSIKSKLMDIECDIDSLKMGQVKIFNGQKVIYEEVKKHDSHFWDTWFN